MLLEQLSRAVIGSARRVEISAREESDTPEDLVLAARQFAHPKIRYLVGEKS